MKYFLLIAGENYYPDIKGFRRALIHLKPDGIEIIPLEYYEYEIKELLKYEKRI